jgi:hypothetical protein
LGLDWLVIRLVVDKVAQHELSATGLRSDIPLRPVFVFLSLLQIFFDFPQKFLSSGMWLFLGEGIGFDHPGNILINRSYPNNLLGLFSSRSHNGALEEVVE